MARKEVTALRERVEELERDRELLNAVANHAPSLLALVDADGSLRPAETNRAFERKLGYAPGEGDGLTHVRAEIPLGSGSGGRG